MTNVTNLGASDEITTVFDYNWTDLPVDSSTNSMEESTDGQMSTEISDVDEYDPDIISVVESTPPHILLTEEDLTKTDPTQKDSNLFPATTVEGTAPSKTTQEPETGPAATNATEGMSDVTATFAIFVPTVTPSEPQIANATEETQTTKADKETTTVITTSVQAEVDESGRTPAYVKSDSGVTQTEKADDLFPVTYSTELRTVTYKAEITEETKSTSATPAAEDSTQSTLQAVSTPFSDDADGKTPTSTSSDSVSSTQDVEGEKETQTPKAFAFNATAPLVSSSSTLPEKTAKTEITAAIDVSSTKSSSQVNMFTASPPLQSSAGTATSSLSPTNTTGQAARESEITLQTVQTAGTDKISIPAIGESVKTSATTTEHEAEKKDKTDLPSHESVTTTMSPLYSAIELVKTTVASFTEFFSQYSTQGATAVTDLPDQSVTENTAPMVTPIPHIIPHEPGSTTLSRKEISGVTEDRAQTQPSTVITVSTAGESADGQTSSTILTGATAAATMLNTERAATGATQNETAHASTKLGTIAPLLTTTEGISPASEVSSIFTPTNEITFEGQTISPEASKESITEKRAEPSNSKETSFTVSSYINVTPTHSSTINTGTYVTKKYSEKASISSSTTVTTTSSLSTDKPSSLSPETKETTSQKEKDSVTSEKISASPTTDEESSVEQTNDLSSKNTAAPTASSLFSTEKPTALPSEEQDSVVIDHTEKPSYQTEGISLSTAVHEEGSGVQTPDMFSSTSFVTDTSSSVFSTVASTALSPGTKASLGTDKTKMPSLTVEPSLSSVSDESLSSSITVFPSLSSFISSTVPDIEDGYISSEITTVESVPAISQSTMKSETASIFITTDTQSSGDNTNEFIEESFFTATTSPSIMSTESPSVPASQELESDSMPSVTVTAASSLYSKDKPASLSPETQETVTTSQTEKDYVTSETSSSSPTADEERSVEQTTDMSSKATAAPTASSLFSTEKPTALPSEEQDSVVTDQTEKPSYEAEGIYINTALYEEGSADEERSVEQTTDMSSKATAIPTASSLFSTEKPTALPTDEERSVEQTTDMSSKATAAPTASSLFSTEKPTALPSEEQDSVVTDQTEKPSYEAEADEERSVEQTTDMSSKATAIPTASSLFSTEKPTALPTDEERSVEQTTDMSSKATAIPTASSLFSTEKPTALPTDEERSVEQTTDMSSKATAAPTASSLFSTEKPTALPTDEERSVEQTTDISSKATAIPTASSLFSTEKPTALPTYEERSVEQTTDMSSKATAAPTASSLFSTEKPTALPSEEQDSVVTDQTEKPSYEAEGIYINTAVYEEGSGVQTPDMFSSTSSVTETSSSVFSTVAPTALSPGTKESLGTDKTKMASVTAEPH
ncbi:serine-rich adhesin for platelets-like [Scophthalmus maximus]|uniref:serine-rich adhesin for platelets-like n=1 Tax=Scophthalmus maximus TaxID=52904 RepID=UPI001FA93463|nr:serine-rich adhesin for platelets-like [Scophthalmus maximus]